MRRSRHRGWAASFALILLLGVAACGSDDAPPVSSSTTVSATTTSTSTTASTTSATPTTTTTETPAPPPPPPAVNALTGGAVSSNLVIAAKIDNTFPGSQWGIGSADVVVVEMVEGNLSRLIAIFHTTLPDEIGPVRSVRTTDPDVLTAYGTPALMISGGAEGPVGVLDASGVVNASADIVPSAYWRSGAASAPYNLHGNVNSIVSSVNGISQPNNPGFSWSNDDPRVPVSRNATTISASFANPISFDYTGNGTYHYIRRGSVQSDGATGAAFEITNVLVQHTSAFPDGGVDSVGSASYKSLSIGGGDVTLYRDGKAMEGKWSRPDATSPTTYVDANGQPMPFKTGNTWIVLAPQQISTGDS